MRFIFPVLKSNTKLGLKDNNDLGKLGKKLGEEFEELLSALAYFRYCKKYGNEEEIEKASGCVALEAMDVIQVSTGIIYAVVAQGFKKAVKEKVVGHIDKLISKGWVFKKGLVAEEQRWE